MKLLATLLSFLLLVEFRAQVHAQSTIYPDVPPPAGGSRSPRLITFKAGSLVIDMGDHQIENTTVSRESFAGLFNLYVYGYAVHLLHNGVPLFWAIKSNKAKDAIDFSAQTNRVHPTGFFSPSTSSNGPWGSTTTALHDFKAGPLIVRNSDADAALAVLATLKSNQNGAGRFRSIVIHRLASDTVIDIRHIILHKPHVFVSTISGLVDDYKTHSELFGHIGLIQGSVESGGMYELVDEGTRIEVFNSSTCHTLFTEPHIIYDVTQTGSCPRCLPTVPKYREALFKFINSGGNFLTQCAGVTSYENSMWASQYHPEAGVEGAFLSKHGIKGLGNRGNEWGGRSNDNDLVYPYADLPAVQFLGNLAGNQTGTITEWYLLGNGDESQLFKNKGHSLIENAKKGAAFRATQAAELKPCALCGDTADNTLPDGRTAFVATAAKIGTNTNGGMVFYLGSHSWWQALQEPSSAITPSGNIEFPSLYNGRRIILNAMLTPSTRPSHCLLSICPEDFECPSADSLGTCQSCECVDGQEVITQDPSMCGTCEVCVSGNCVRDDSLCGECEVCISGNCVRNETMCRKCECPPAESLGTCQTCECIDGQEVITQVPSMCGSCEVCNSGNCVRNDSLCGECEVCISGNCVRNETMCLKCECPSADNLGSCQTCECIDGLQVLTQVPSMCGSCEVCNTGSCVRDDTMCGECEECTLNQDTQHHDCADITTGDCGASSDGLTPQEQGTIAGAVIGAVLGATLGAALLMIGAGILAWKLLKKPPVAPVIEGVLNMEQSNVDVNDNWIFDDPVKVYESNL